MSTMRDAPLLRTEVLIVDIQAAGSVPERSQILEMGWARFRACDAPEGCVAEVERVAVPVETEVPARVLRITRLSPGELPAGKSSREVYSRLVQTACRVDGSSSIAVAHFARYEGAFLQYLHSTYFPGAVFPFQLCCTHALSRRLFPGLPRRGLRAVAGYLGLAVGEARRSGEHVSATAYIWSEVVKRLVGLGVESFVDLQQWLEKDAPEEITTPRRYPMNRSVRSGLPDKPGVYGMLRSDGSLLYIGKAISLRRRVASYFTRTRHSDPILEMLTQARDVKVTTTFSALEAALLECELIKALDPPYNQALRSNGRCALFAGPDLASFASSPDQRHTLGPFQRGFALEVLGWLTRRVVEGAADAGGFPTLPYLGAGDLTEDVETAYTDLAREHSLGTTVVPFELRRSLLRLGRRLLNERQEGPPEEQAETEDGVPETSDTSRPRVTAAWFEHILMEAAVQFERAAWFGRMADGMVRWRSREGRWLIVVLVEGRLVYAGQQDDEEEVPRIRRMDARHGMGGRSTVEESRSDGRGAPLDYEGCERLRVLTTELKRLTKDGREVEVWPSFRSAPVRGRRLRTWLSFM